MHFPLDGTEVNVDALCAMLRDGEEIAVLDTRNEGVYARGHLLMAASMPMSRLELDVTRCIPRSTTRIVIVDDTPAQADAAVARLRAGGYSQVAALDAGNHAWVNNSGGVSMR